jgi:DNA-binding transcriptional MerR regulator
MDSNGPRKIYYSISEVSEITDIKPHILRFWEKDFSMLRPRKNRAGNRSYRERDIRVVLAIKRLLYEDRYTIKGASDRLRQDRSLIDEMEIQTVPGGEAVDRSTDVPTEVPPEGPAPSLPSPDPVPPPSGDPPEVRDLLNDLRQDLAGLLRLIDGKW